MTYNRKLGSDGAKEAAEPKALEEEKKTRGIEGGRFFQSAIPDRGGTSS